MRPNVVVSAIVLTGLFAVPPAAAQFFGVCNEGTSDDLNRSIAGHEEHTRRLYEKFLAGFYLQGKMPEFEAATLDNVGRYLAALEPRRAAALFYAYNEQRRRLCTWLVTPDRPLASHVTTVQPSELRSAQSRLMQGLGVRTMEGSRRVVRGQLLEPSSAPENVAPRLKRVGAILLPDPIARELIAQRIDSLSVIPIFALGTVPFAALPLGDKMVIDQMEVIFVPGFFVFKEEPRRSVRSYSQPVIVGDPVSNPGDKSRLPGARAEAVAAAEKLGTSALVGGQATIAEVNRRIGPQTGLIYLATHGVSDSANPLDGSYLTLADGRWPAADIHTLPLKGSRPLVVLSACQTGLGKDFDVGTTGMARAWQFAGASAVVMSLWNVDDDATRRLMTGFVDRAGAMPADRALRLAMLAAREQHGDPALWAGFAVFGAPERP